MAGLIALVDAGSETDGVGVAVVSIGAGYVGMDLVSYDLVVEGGCES